MSDSNSQRQQTQEIETALFIHENGVKILCVRGNCDTDNNLKCIFDIDGIDGLEKILKQDIIYISSCKISTKELKNLAEMLKVDIIVPLNITLRSIRLENSHFAKVSHFCLYYDRLCTNSNTSYDVSKIYNLLLIIEQFNSIKRRLNIN